jgi:3-deoxy-D-manno-octulosonic-acid transferase
VRLPRGRATAEILGAPRTPCSLLPTPSPSLPTSLAYRALARLADRALPLAALGSDKLARGDRERRAALARWIGWAAAARSSAPLLWCHAPSVGEGLQAEAVLRILRQRHPDWQIAYTFFSPSAEALARRLPVDRADYLPYDTAARIDRLLGALRPAVLTFTKLDLWPELATRAAGRGTRVALVAATVSPVSRRLRWPARALARPGYAALTAAGAVAEADAGRLVALGVPADRVTLTGDPRFDSAWERARRVAPEEPLLRFGRGAPTLIAGSTWPADEAVLLSAFARVRRDHPEARLVLVPHEPDDAHLRGVARRAARAGLPPPVRLSQAAGPVPFLLVDRVGALATLYGSGDLAYVGGGFGRAGLHSLLEPAAAGRPSIMGPRWAGSREAGLLLEVGAAVALPEGRGPAVAALAATWSGWISQPERRAAAGGRALELVRAGLGAAERNAALLERLMEEGLLSARR